MHFSRWPGVALSGVAQTAFCERPVCGLMLLLAIGILSPVAAAAALAGSLAGTAVAYTLHTWSGPEKAAGLPGVNLAILGILWSGALARGSADPMLLFLSAVACLALEQAARRVLVRYSLPLLSFPAVSVALLVELLYRSSGQTMLAWPPAGPSGAAMAAAPLLVFAALVVTNRAAALLTTVLATAAALLSAWIAGGDWPGPAGLWAFAVAPAAFGVHAVFLAGSLTGALAGVAAGLLATLLWLAWIALPQDFFLPPLLLPFIAATWLVLAAVRRRHGPLVLDPALWATAGAIREAWSMGRGVVALTGAGASTASGIPDYVSGTWLDPDVPLSTYSWERFLRSPYCRKAYWEACERFRRIAGAARPNPGHLALAALGRSGILSAVVTQNVDGLHQVAGSPRTIDLHGRIDSVWCVDCHQVSTWPATALWRNRDLRCVSCGGLIKPAVIAFGEDIPDAAWKLATDAVRNCGVLIAVGTRLSVSSAAALEAQARQAGARIVTVTTGETTREPGPDDILIQQPAEDCLPALALLLDCPLPPGDGDRRPGSGWWPLRFSLPRVLSRNPGNRLSPKGSNLDKTRKIQYYQYVIA